MNFARSATASSVAAFPRRPHSSIGLFAGLLVLGLLLLATGEGADAARTRKPENRVLPRISGTVVRGQVLKASTGRWSASPTHYAYRWKDCDRTASRCTTVVGAHEPTLTLTGRDVGKRMRIVVTASNASGSAAAESTSTSFVRMIAVVISTSGSDSACTRGQKPAPCATFGRAYQLARCGDIVGVESGAYPAQTIVYEGSRTCTGEAVLVQPLEGAVSIRSPNCMPTPEDCTALVLGRDVSSVDAPSWLTIRGIRILGDIAVYGNGGAQGDHITLDRVAGGGGLVSDATNFVLSNSVMGPCQNDDVRPHETPCDSNFIFASQDNGSATTATLVRDTFRDFTKAGVDSHFECLFILDVTSVVVENSRFYDCMEAGIQLEYRETPRSVTVQNNWFGRTSDADGTVSECNAIRLSGNAGTLTNTLIRFNSFAHGQGVIHSSGSPTSGVRIVGNTFGLDPTEQCATGTVGFAGAAWDYNVWEGHRWGAHSRTVSNIGKLYVNASDLADGDYHLVSRKTAADSLVTGTSPDDRLSRDRDGQLRRGARDAGADQRVIRHGTR